jgi:hypothetical protein
LLWNQDKQCFDYSDNVNPNSFRWKSFVGADVSGGVAGGIGGAIGGSAGEAIRQLLF